MAFAPLLAFVIPPLLGKLGLLAGVSLGAVAALRRLFIVDLTVGGHRLRHGQGPPARPQPRPARSCCGGGRRATPTPAPVPA